MILVKLDKSVKDQITARITKKARGICEGLVSGINFKLEEVGSDTRISFAQGLETLILSNLSTNNGVITIDENIYTYNDIMKNYIDKKCISEVNVFLSDNLCINKYIDEVFKDSLRIALSSIEEDINLEDTTEYDIDNNYTYVYRQIEKICEDTGSHEYDEIKDYMEDIIMDKFGLTRGVMEYCKFHKYREDIVDYNKKRLEKLVELYLIKNEKEDTYKLNILKQDMRGEHLYKQEYERFLESNCKDLSIK